jgi:hypothetical protein
MIKMKNGIPV